MVLKTIAVTGASGMVGRHLLTALDEAGLGIAATSRSRPVNLPEAAKWTAWDLLEWKTPDQLDLIFGDVDAVIHAGAAVPSRNRDLTSGNLFDTNVRASLALGTWAADRKLPLLLISSATVYADPTATGIIEQATVSPAGLGEFYRTTKLLAEQVLQGLTEPGLELCIFRPTSIYGIGLPEGKMISDFLATAGRRETIRISQPIDDRVNLIHARDIADAAVAALSTHASGVFNIAGPRLVTVEEIATASVSAAGGGTVSVEDGKPSRPATNRFDLDIAKAREQFGFEPKIELDDGLAMMRASETASRSDRRPGQDPA